MFRQLKLLKSNLSTQTEEIKETPAATAPQAKPSEDLTHAAFRGTMTGLIVPLGTVPFDRAAAHFQIDDKHSFHKRTTWTDIFNQPKTGVSANRALKATWQGYPFVAKTNIMRYGLTYLIAPAVTNQLKQNGVSEDKSRVVGNTVAGGLDGLVSGVFSPIRQYYFTQPAKTHEVTNMLDKAARQNLLQKSRVATPYVLLRNTLYWPIYNEIVRATEKKMDLNEKNKLAVNTTKEFVAGAKAGLATTFLTHPLDALRTRHTHFSYLSLKEIIKTGYKEFGVSSLPKLYYRGLSFGLFRSPIAMGLTNIAKHAADRAYDESKKFQKK